MANWNPTLRQYERRGEPIPISTVRGWIEQARESSALNLEETARLYRAGEINRAEWFIRSREEIVRSHSAVAMVAQGGREQMTPAAWGRTGQVIRAQVNDHLRGFERDEANGAGGSDAQFIARARSYANSLFAAHENAVLARDRDAGAVRRVIRHLEKGAKHCELCPELAGMYDIADAPPIGGDSTPCGDSCMCWYEAIAEAA